MRADSGPGVGFDPDLILDSVGGDRDLVCELFQAYVEDGPERARDLAQALEVADLDRVVRRAHSLKSMSGVIRAESIMAMALEVESAARRGDLAGARAAHQGLDLVHEDVLKAVKTYLETQCP
ncbi:MAG: Hpt domain-containing protein [Desulfovibrionaceae bacterium]|nr:Hpt domain-containing protein [Desulfovibrionaceae bacterium]